MYGPYLPFHTVNSGGLLRLLPFQISSATFYYSLDSYCIRSDVVKCSVAVLCVVKKGRKEGEERREEEEARRPLSFEEFQLPAEGRPPSPSSFPLFPFFVVVVVVASQFDESISPLHPYSILPLSRQMYFHMNGSRALSEQCVCVCNR